MERCQKHFYKFLKRRGFLPRMQEGGKLKGKKVVTRKECKRLREEVEGKVHEKGR